MSLRKTPLHGRHIALGARLVPFSGWEMPVQYASILEEHSVVREKAGLFDVSHMGEIVLRGAGALALLERVSCNSVSSIEIGKVQYNAILNENGGIVDDVTIYRTGTSEFFMVSNAANYGKVFTHLRKHANGDVALIDESDDWALLALQGPSAESVLNAFVPGVAGIDYYAFDHFEWNGVTLRVSRTGYTGTDGFEIYSPVRVVLELWDALLAAGEQAGVKPAGLGARDILRLEAGMPLWGNELSEEWTPVQSSIAWIVKEKNPPYLGYETIMRHKQEGPPGKVVGFIMEEKGGVPRHEYPVYDAGENRQIGSVLSGAHSPVLALGIGTTYLPIEFTAPDTRVKIEIRGRRLAARLHRGAFIPKTSGKKS